MAQSFQVAPEYVDEITFTTKVSSIEYRVSNQIQVSINIVGIRYRTPRVIYCLEGRCLSYSMVFVLFIAHYKVMEHFALICEF